MDKRVYKTKISIINAFNQLIQKKRIEKITVKELTDLAVIHKTTFYRYFEDIYTLLDHVEDEFVEEYISGLDDVFSIFTNPNKYVQAMTSTFISLQPLSTFLLRNGRKEVLFSKMADAQLQALYKQRPDLINNQKFKITFEYLNGGLSSIGLDHYSDSSSQNEIFEVIANIIKHTLAEFREL